MAALTFTIVQTGTTAAENTKFASAASKIKQLLDEYGLGYTDTLA